MDNIGNCVPTMHISTYILGSHNIKGIYRLISLDRRHLGEGNIEVIWLKVGKNRGSTAIFPCHAFSNGFLNQSISKESHPQHVCPFKGCVTEFSLTYSVTRIQAYQNMPTGGRVPSA